MAMREHVEGLGRQVEWAAEAEVPPVATVRDALVCGMGGSGISGDYLSVLAAEAGNRVAVHKGYGLPGWVRAIRPLVLAISYSGDTEETLSAVEQAADLGLDVAVVTSGGTLARLASDRGWPTVVVPGGLQPRAALGYLLGATARLAGTAGLLPGVLDQLKESAGVIGDLVTDPGWSLAADLAEGLDDRIALVYGSVELTAPVANRWKTQINENAKRPAWWGVFPELDHNEIVGWAAEPGLSRRVGIVALRDRAEPPGIARRVAATREVTGGEVEWVGEVHSQGESLLARLLSSTVVGDMVSVVMAERSGVDPMPVTVIQDLKRRLREET